MSTSIGAARIDIEINTADYELAIQRAKNAAAGFGAEAEQAFTKQEGTSKRAARALLDYVNNLSKTKDELKLLKAAGSGVDPVIIDVATKAMNEYTASVNRAAAESETLKAAMAQDASINNYLASLERQIALFGMSGQEMRRYEAATSDVSQKALALVSTLEQLEAQQTRDNATERMTASLREQIATLGMSSQELRRYQAQVAGIGAEVAPLLSQLDALESKMAFQGKVDAATASLERQIATFGMSPSQIRRYELALDGVEKQVSPLVAKLEELEAEARRVNYQMQESTKVNSFLDSLRNQSEAIGKTNSQLLEMKAAQLGVSQQAAPFIAKLREQEEALTRSGRTYEKGVNAVNKYGMSQKQLEFAMRGVPAQMTDIFVSLQGGQAPMTVLLQQGGQLKDMFGGIKPAAAALAGELWKMVNIYTVTAAALGTLVVAYAKAAKEQDQFNKAIIQSGGYSAKTLEQVNDLAASLDNIAGVSRMSAGNLIQSITAMGTFTSEQMELAAQAALRWGTVTGDKADEVVKKFDRIRKDPVAALKELNAAESFLTEEQLKRIQVLVEEGDQQAAVTEAFRLYSDVVTGRADEIASKLGGISTAWMNIKWAAMEAWDELTVAVGKADSMFKTFADRVADAGKFQQGATLTSIFAFNPAAAALTYLAGNRGGAAAGDAEARQQEIRNEQALKAEDDAKKAWLDIGNRYLTDLQRQENEEKEIRAAALKAKISDVELEAQLAAMREKYRKNQRTPRGNNDAERAALQAFKDQAEIAMATVNANAKTTQAAFQAQQISADAYYSAMRGYAEEELRINERSIQGQIAYLQSARDTINTRRQIGELEANLAKVRAQAAAEAQVLNTQEADAIRKRNLEMMQFTENLQRANAAYSRTLDAQVAAVGMGAKEAQQLAAVTALYVEQADKIYELERAKANNPGLAAQYEEQVAQLRAYYTERVDILQRSYGDMAAAEADWTNGYKRAFADLLEENRNIADNTYQFVQGTTGEITNIFEELVMTGKASTDSLVSYMLKQLARLGTQKVLGYLMSMWSPGGNNPYGVQAETIPLTMNAKGGVYSSPDLSQFSGQVHNSPQLFKFAKGGGVFGEAGPEAIMPLRRTSSGRLGVEMTGGKGGAPVINVNLIGAPEGTQVGAAREESDGSFTMDILFGQVEGYLAGQVANGAGSLNGAMKSRYGLKETV